MLSISVRTEETKEGYLKKAFDAMKGLVETGVVAGFPKGKLNTPYYENGASIIDVAMWNNYGTNIPQRDFMTPSSKKWMKFFEENLRDLGKDIANGNVDAIKFLRAMGRKGQNIIRNEIIKLDTPPNAPSTIKAKGSNNPLVDTGAMARATTWQIRKGKRR